MRVFNPLPTLIRELTPKTIFVMLLVTFLYLSLSLYVFNFRFVGEVITGTLPVSQKISLLIGMLPGIWTVYPMSEFILLLITATLVGLQSALLLKELRKIRREGAVKLSLGSMLVSGVGIGCPSCGITLLSLLGPSTSLVLLPYQTTALQYIGIGLLIFSLYSLLKNINAVCFVKPKGKSTKR